MELNATIEHLKSTSNEQFQTQWNSVKRVNRSGETVSEFFQIQRVGELMSLTTSTRSVKFNLDEQWLKMTLDEIKEHEVNNNLNTKKVSETKPFLF